MTAADVLRFWFDETPPERRFAADPEFDATIRARFGAATDASLDGARPFGDDDPHDAQSILAHVILLDQFPRNLHRGSARAFAGDAPALGLTKNALARGLERALTPELRQFLLMPLMHSEASQDQARSVELFAALGCEQAADYARSHRDTIARFGRFPARNAALGHESTAEELAFLEERPEGF